MGIGIGNRPTAWIGLNRIVKIAVNEMPELGYSTKDVTARSLRSGGAMALLCGRVDKEILQLLGRWKSEAMFHYLHAQAAPIIHNLATTMFPFAEPLEGWPPHHMFRLAFPETVHELVVCECRTDCHCRKRISAVV